MRQSQMTPRQYEVAQWMEKAGFKVPATPTVPGEKERELRARLILEEAMEVIEALGVTLETSIKDGESHPIVFDSFEFITHEDEMCDLEAVADGLSDLDYVTLGCFCSFGIENLQINNEVDANNRLKLENGKKNRKTGKLEKAKDHPAPYFRGILEEQGWEIPADKGVRG